MQLKEIHGKQFLKKINKLILLIILVLVIVDSFYFSKKLLIEIISYY